MADFEDVTPAGVSNPEPSTSQNLEFAFDTIEDALQDLAAGRAIVVVDDENRENEGDVICAAQFATPDMINFMAVEARGLICLAMTGQRLDELELPLMVTQSSFEDENEQTAFTVSIDAALHWGVTTGISAEDRARTIQVALNPGAQPKDLRRPGHIFPLRAKAGGVLKRAGHTEAAVDIARLAGLTASLKNWSSAASPPSSVSLPSSPSSTSSPSPPIAVSSPSSPKSSDSRSVPL